MTIHNQEKMIFFISNCLSKHAKYGEKTSNAIAVLEPATLLHLPVKLLCKITQFEVTHSRIL